MTFPRVWVISELYYPEETSTGYLLTHIAEGIAARRRVGVLAAQPTYAARGTRAPRREVRNGVEIERCPSTSFSKDSLPFRIVNMLTITVSIFVTALRRLGAGDQVIVVTNPPLLPYAVAVASRLRRCKTYLLIHDVYPEVLYTTGFLSRRSIAAHLAEWLSRRLYRSMHRVIALGRDMAALAIRKTGEADKVVVIPNWADADEIFPAARSENRLLRDLELLDRFVIQYAGNMGRTHALEDILEAARCLEGSHAHFLFIGSGAKKRWVEQQARSLANVTVLGSLPRSEQQNFLNACDAAIISFVPGMAGISVPSRMYNVMAAGRPIIAVADRESELARVVTEEDIGWVVPPRSVEALVDVIRQAMMHPDTVAEMGRRARAAAEARYRFERIADAYGRLLES